MIWLTAEGVIPSRRAAALNQVFKGTPASMNAPFSKGRFPLIVMSHGSGGRIQGMSWLAAELAKAGFIVGGPNHPGTTSGNSTPADTPKLWERTQDLSTVIDTMTADPLWRHVVDPGKIGIVGFSLGGSAAIEIAGARANLDDYARYCDTYTKWDCAWFAGAGRTGFRHGTMACREGEDRDAGPQLYVHQAGDHGQSDEICYNNAKCASKAMIAPRTLDNGRI